MKEKEKDREEKLKKECLDEKEKEIADDWADLASQELADYIEEQGIQIRY